MSGIGPPRSRPASLPCPSLRRFRLPILACAAVLAAAPAASAREALEAAEPYPLEPAAEPAAVFPIDARVHFGGHATRFGGGRGHQGQDVFADCGTPLAAVAGGRVLDARFHGSAGHYVVVRTEGGRSHVYAHLRAPAHVKAGEAVEAGERLGSVGDTGNAWDCHLHFEVWTAPGWYRGGRPIDPLPLLRRLRADD